MMAQRAATWSRLLWVLLSSVGLLYGVAYLSGIRINLTGSLPPGLYRIASLEHGPVQQGEIVLFCLSGEPARLARARGYIPRGLSRCSGDSLPVGKRVIGLPLQEVEISESGTILVDGSEVGRLGPERDSRHRPIPWMEPTRLRIPAETYWVLGEHPLSFDSRVFGPVQREQLFARAKPLLLW